MQRAAAEAGVAPRVHMFDEKNKFIVMDKLAKTCVEVAKEQGGNLTESQQEQIISLIEGLTRAGVLHNDGNAQNVMVDEEGRFYFIDYGFSKKISAADVKKYGPDPNTSVVLFMLFRSLRHYGIRAPLLQQHVRQYEANRR